VEPQTSGDGEDSDTSRDLSRLPKWAQREIEQLRREAAARRVSERTATVNMRAMLASGRLGINPEALLGSTDWAARAQQLDPNAPDFAERLEEAMQATAQVHPWVRAQPAGPARSGPEIPNSPPAPPRNVSLHAAVARRFGG
jgi:hypothetical protein